MKLFAESWMGYGHTFGFSGSSTTPPRRNIDMRMHAMCCTLRGAAELEAQSRRANSRVSSVVSRKCSRSCKKYQRQVESIAKFLIDHGLQITSSRSFVPVAAPPGESGRAPLQPPPPDSRRQGSQSMRPASLRVGPVPFTGVRLYMSGNYDGISIPHSLPAI